MWGKYSGGERNTGKPFQFKLFSGKHYALIMEDNEGKWSSSVAGSYVLDGNIYRETVQYASPSFPKEVIGLTMDWKYEIKGDTLFMEGPLKVVDTKGNDLSASMGGLNSMKEKRVRAR